MATSACRHQGDVDVAWRAILLHAVVNVQVKQSWASKLVHILCQGPRDNWWDGWHWQRAVCVSSPSSAQLSSGSTSEHWERCLQLFEWEGNSTAQSCDLLRCTSNTSSTHSTADTQKTTAGLAHRPSPGSWADWYPSLWFPVSDSYEQKDIHFATGKTDGRGKSYSCLSQKCRFQSVTQWENTSK